MNPKNTQEQKIKINHLWGPQIKILRHKLQLEIKYINNDILKTNQDLKITPKHPTTNNSKN